MVVSARRINGSGETLIRYGFRRLEDVLRGEKATSTITPMFGTSLLRFASLTIIRRPHGGLTHQSLN